MTNDYAKYEKACAIIRKENETLIEGFGCWLNSKGLSNATVRRHCENVEFYINTYLLYDDAVAAKSGVGNINMYLGYWFIRKAMWSSAASIKSNATSIKKFYTFMLEKGEVEAEDVADLKNTIKEEMPEWVATSSRYDDPEIDDMGEVWGI